MDIIGGGPAGSVAALCLARRGWRVRLFEATRFDTDRYGETLPPEINPVLRELELLKSFESLQPMESPGILSRWGGQTAHEQDFIFNVHGCGWHVDRNRFDAMLCTEAEQAGAELHLGCRLAAHRNGRFILDASGRNGLRLNGDCTRDVDDVLLAIVLRVACEEADLRTYIEAASEGWWYSTPLPQGGVLAMFFTDREAYAHRVDIGQQLRYAPLTEERMARAKVEGRRVIYAPSSCKRELVGDNWLALGDSASCYDPLSGRGIFKAMRHSVAAVEALASDDLEGYEGRVKSEFAAYVEQRRSFYAISADQGGFWQRRLAR